MKKTILISGLFLTGIGAMAQTNDECSEMEPICTDAGLSFTAQTGVSIGPDPNDYGCLFSQPNPTWYYFEIATDGNIDMNLWAPSDIDFIIWGPFDDLAEAQSYCGQMGVSPNAPEVDCSYSGTNDEYPSIPSAVTGDVYVMLITNYASVVQDVTLTQVGGTGSTDCSIITPDPCVSDPGTYTVEKNGTLSSSPVYLCQGESFEAISDGNYILPNDTIPLPVGDGVYSAQLMWLVYDAAPTSGDPATDPGFLNMIIPSEDLSDINNGTSPIVSGLGCGTYWFVPVAGDDGVGGNNNVANGVNDNGGLHWDKNNNDCFLLGTPIQVTYACEMQTTVSLDCNPPTTINGIDVQITGGAPGNYTVVNQGDGNLVSGSVPNGGTANINNLENNEGWEIDITDAQGCTTSASGVFVAPVFQNITITPAPTCPSASNGQVDVTVNGTSGNGAPYTIIMAGDPPTTGTTDSYSDGAGTAVYIVIADDEGCISDSTVTITSAGHFIDVDIISVTGEDCYGDNQGSAQISAIPTPSGNVTSITWTGPSGQHPGGDPGGPANNSQSAMEPGNWIVTIVDDLGCEVSIPIEITSPQALDLYVSNSNQPTCYAYSDGSITVQSTGGSGGLVYSWNPVNGVPGNTFNNLEAGIYWAYVTDQNGCEDSVMIDLGQPDSLYGVFTVKDVLCYGDSTGAIIVDDVVNEVGTVSYFWNLSGVVPNPPSTSNVANGLPIGTYVLTIQDAMCYNQYEFTLTQNPEIVFAEFGSHPAFCRMFSYQSGNGVVYASASGGVPDYEYEWVNLSTGATTNATTWGGLNPATYQMTVTDDVGCTLVETIQLDSVNPIANFNVLSADASLDIPSLSGTAIVCTEFENTSQYFANEYDPLADTTFFWEMGYGLPWQISHDVNEVFDTCYYSEGQYEVCLVALNKNGCSDTTCKVLTIYDYPTLVAPNVFTPGNDAANPLFTFENRQTAIVEFECTVFDRWGKEMFQFTSITDAWDGTTKNGKPATDGVYFFIYHGVASNGTEFEGQGTVHLIRN
ncbi:MAG: gliding motility-associated C-terminal domain-containing protein [Crocinitomicaceae bacterium]|nr:gliding motility-associated C-terminal domain-containing protein [Crocinitomicaceae bacterium]